MLKTSRPSTDVLLVVLLHHMISYDGYQPKQAYRSYLLAYSSHSLKNIYDVHELDLQKVARAFGFTVPPRVSTVLCTVCTP